MAASHQVQGGFLEDTQYALFYVIPISMPGEVLLLPQSFLLLGAYKTFWDAGSSYHCIHCTSLPDWQVDLFIGRDNVTKYNRFASW